MPENGSLFGLNCPCSVDVKFSGCFLIFGPPNVFASSECIQAYFNSSSINPLLILGLLYAVTLRL